MASGLGRVRLAFGKPWLITKLVQSRALFRRECRKYCIQGHIVTWSLPKSGGEKAIKSFVLAIFVGVHDLPSVRLRFTGYV
ncbi:MAG TPA: hypothetical protein VGY66_22405, partial [Gemmataceae bacterium]|nr:hypothetical protein [Gemmataceae bacterium]